MKEFDEKQKTFEEAKDQVLALRDTPAPAGGGPAPAESKAADAPDWTQVYDEASQSYYYFNEKTQETSWSAPGKDYESDGYDTTGSRGTAVDYDTDAYDNMGGDGGEWSEQYDENAQATYWFNNVTYEATWTPPPGFDAGPPQASGEWASYMDPEGTEYWYNDTTGETSWEPPTGG